MSGPATAARGTPIGAFEIATAAKALPVTIGTVRALVQMAAAMALSLDATGKTADVDLVFDALVAANAACDVLTPLDSQRRRTRRDADDHPETNGVDYVQLNLPWTRGTASIGYTLDDGDAYVSEVWLGGVDIIEIALSADAVMRQLHDSLHAALEAQATAARTDAAVEAYQDAVAV